MDYVVQIDWLKHSTAEAIDDGTGKLTEIVYYIIIPNSQATIGYWEQHVLNTKYFFNKIQLFLASCICFGTW